MNKNLAVALWVSVLAVGIGMLFLEQTKNIGPFLIGFGMARLAVVSSRKEKEKPEDEEKTEDKETDDPRTYY